MPNASLDPENRRLKRFVQNRGSHLAFQRALRCEMGYPSTFGTCDRLPTGSVDRGSGSVEGLIDRLHQVTAFPTGRRPR